MRWVSFTFGLISMQNPMQIQAWAPAWLKAWDLAWLSIRKTAFKPMSEKAISLSQQRATSAQLLVWSWPIAGVCKTAIGKEQCAKISSPKRRWPHSQSLSLFLCGEIWFRTGFLHREHNESCAKTCFATLNWGRRPMMVGRRSRKFPSRTPNSLASTLLEMVF